jgi:21S rRNA (GM2251-2'-O)-methyltransferase
MNHLEGAGFVHLYGLSSVLNALQANRRDLVTVQDRAAQLLDEEEAEGEYSSTEREPPKPQAQFRPYLFVQERKGTSRRGQKASDAERLLALAEERNVPVAEVDKGILNTLSGNRPHQVSTSCPTIFLVNEFQFHLPSLILNDLFPIFQFQGFVLRCGKLYFESLSRIPVPDDSAEEETPSLWLVLDEVVDPQNLGALLRSAYFLGQKKLGILVCSKNSAPPTPVVSAASAGALELVSVYSTNNLPRTLNQARDDGFRIIGASSSVPNSSGSSEFDDESEDAPPPLFDLSDLPVSHEEDDRPVLLVLGSEGHGLRTLVAKACTEFVRIPSGGQASSEDEEDGEGVDSLNVSVTGGILLWQLLSGRK